MPVIRPGNTFWFALALTSALCGAARAQDCALKPLASLDMHTTPGGTFTIPVKLNDTEVQFLVDTGAFFSTVDPDVAHTLHMSTRRVGLTVVGIGNERTDTMVSPDDFWVGPVLHSSKYWFYLRPYQNRNFAGTLATDFLRSFDMDLDFAGGKFNIVDPEHCPGKVVYWNPDSFAVVPIDTTGHDQHTEIPVTVNGISTTAMIDTGSTVSVMSMKEARSIGVRDGDPALVSAKRVINGREMMTYSYPFKTIQFAGIAAGSGVTINNPNVIIIEDSMMHDFKAELVLGISTLRQLHLYIAYKEHKMYLSPATTGH